MSQTIETFAALDRQRLQLLQRLGLQPRCFFDVGASNGYWSRLVSEDFPEARFEMFEPLSDHAEEYRGPMQNLLKENPRVRLHKLAVGAETKPIKMYMLSDRFGSTALDLGVGPKGSQCVEVDMTTIDDAISRFDLPVPNVIKVDTQGCELAVLQGAQKTLPDVDLLLLETWLTRGYGPATPLLIELADWLRDFNFYFWDFGDVWRDDQGILISQDCLFLNTRCKISQLRKEPRRQPRSNRGGFDGSQKSWLHRVRNAFR